MPKINQNTVMTAAATLAGIFIYRKFVSPTVKSKLLNRGVTA